jgi:hypothetical protein
LSDVFSREGGEHQEPSLQVQFAGSRWFTRGWTLQELLAPSSVVFYLQDWTVYGTKSFLHEEVSRITGVPTFAMTKPNSVKEFSVAQRISWASNRQTTRPEDISYCLLGILGVHMPLLYGEGARAFSRLQEEVMKSGTDPTIFAWPSSDVAVNTWEGPLAPSPAAFRFAGNHRVFTSGNFVEYGPWSVTNRGIRIEDLPILEESLAKALLDSEGFHRWPNKTYAVALIGCYREKQDGQRIDKQFGIALYKHGDIYYRFRTPESLLLIDHHVKISARVNCILHLAPVVTYPKYKIRPDSVCPRWIIRKCPDERHGFTISDICGRCVWGSDFKFFSYPDLRDDMVRPASRKAIIFSNNTTKEEFFVVVRVNKALPWIHVSTNITREACLDSPFAFGVDYTAYVDQTSSALRNGKEVIVKVICGVDNGERVFFLDVCIQDVQ